MLDLTENRNNFPLNKEKNRFQGILKVIRHEKSVLHSKSVSLIPKFI